MRNRRWGVNVQKEEEKEMALIGIVQQLGNQKGNSDSCPRSKTAKAPQN